MKKVIKILNIVLTISIIVIIFGNTITLAAQSAIPDTEKFDPTDSLDTPTEFITVVGMIASLLQIIGVVISVISISILGIKYMVGSVEAKAEYKKAMIPFIVGSIFMILTGTILRIINDLTSQTIK